MNESMNLRPSSIPRVSVIMPVYNGEQFLREAVDSILGQTFTDFEFIIIDDGSTDGTRAILESYSDPRIVLVHQENQGLVRSLNRGLRMARGEYIARQDADDVSLPERLEKQVAYLDTHPMTGVLGTGIMVTNSSGVPVMTFINPGDNSSLQSLLFTTCCFAHGEVMLRQAVVESVGYYDESYAINEDYEYWLRAAERWELAIVSEILYRKRQSDIGMLSRVGPISTQRYGALALGNALKRRTSSSVLRNRYSSRDLATGYVALACRQAALGESSVARASIRIAGEIDHSLDSAFFSSLVGRYVSATADQWKDWSNPAGQVKAIYACLPPERARWHASAGLVIAQMECAAAFVAYGHGDMNSVRRHAILAIRHDPPVMRNRGLLSILAESILGHRAALMLRRGGAKMRLGHDGGSEEHARG